MVLYFIDKIDCGRSSHSTILWYFQHAIMLLSPQWCNLDFASCSNFEALHFRPLEKEVYLVLFKWPENLNIEEEEYSRLRYLCIYTLLSFLCLILCQYLCRCYIFTLTIEVNVLVAPLEERRKGECADCTSFNHDVNKLPISTSILDYWQRVVGRNWVPAPLSMYVKRKNHG